MQCIILNAKKSNLHYTRGSNPQRAASGGAQLRGLATQLRRTVPMVANRWRHWLDPPGDRAPKPPTPTGDSEC